MSILREKAATNISWYQVPGKISAKHRQRRRLLNSGNIPQPSGATFGVRRTIQTPHHHSNPTTFPAMATTVKKTYHRRTRTMASVSSSPQVLLTPARASSKRKREEDDSENIHPTKRQNTTSKSQSTITSKNKQPPPSKKPQRKPLTQLHLAFSAQPALRSCNLCGLSYTHGTPEDESLHRSHCARVKKGMEWGLKEEKESGGVGVSVVRGDVKLKCGSYGRIISFRADASGRIGTKVSGPQVAEEQEI